jgi:Putative auto-transporter adhesin, head GIN domain
MRTNTAIVFASVVFLAAFATGCGTGNAETSGGSDKDQARLEINGSPGSPFSGYCAIGDEGSEEIGGEVPQTFTYDLGGRALDCEVSSDGALRVEFTVGENHRSVQSISGGTLKLTYEDGSISSATSSSSRSVMEGSSSSSQVTSSAKESGKDTTSVAEESRDVSGFDEVELRGAGNLSIEQTGGESLTVEAEEDVLPKLTTEVVNDRLIIGPKPGTTVRTTAPINYKLTVEALNALEVSGAGDVEAEGINTDRLAVTIGGAGNVKAGGEADKQEIDISGSGAYRAENLESKEAKIGVSGAGSAIVNASERLDATVSGAGSVEYVGDPTVEQDVSGAGRVSKY